jgi:hypothetical protein
MIFLVKRENKFKYIAIRLKNTYVKRNFYKSFNKTWIKNYQSTTSILFLESRVTYYYALKFMIVYYVLVIKTLT